MVLYSLNTKEIHKDYEIFYRGKVGGPDNDPAVA
jgi:hypothetical protein